MIQGSHGTLHIIILCIFITDETLIIVRQTRNHIVFLEIIKAACFACH